ncbi:MAG: peptidase [Anaerolineaceae bacterium 4572_78]|nr:MAG: peptidase [Anaerolineaceae bacterium 4572_78]
MAANINQNGFSKIKEVVASWNEVKQLLRSGEDGNLVPVVIPKEKRSFGWMGWFGLAFYFFVALIWLPVTSLLFGVLAGIVFVVFGSVAARNSILVEIEQGTTGVLSKYGKIVGVLEPGRHFLFWPWEKVEYIVDTSTEIPYTAPVLACPTKENVPLKSIEFFLKLRITDPIRFVRNIGASNFDIVLSSAVQDAIRRRCRLLETANAYDLRGSDVGGMRETLNRQMSRYGIKITGANIPDVRLPDQYQGNLATHERVAKERSSYEKEWELTKKQRNDMIHMEIERAKKDRDEKLRLVKEAVNQAKESVAQMLQEQEAKAEKIRLDIEADGQAELTSAENEARALTSLGKSYQDNRAVLQYELEMRRLDVAEKLVKTVPRPILVNQSGGESALSTLILAKALPDIVQSTRSDGHMPSGQQGDDTADVYQAVRTTASAAKRFAKQATRK